MLNILLGGVIGYFSGLLIWNKFIYPILKRKRQREIRQNLLLQLEMAKIIGNPISTIRIGIK